MRKGSQEKAKESERYPHSHCQESHKNPKLNNHNTFTDDLVQNHAGSVIATLVCVSPYELCLVLLGSSTPLAPTILSSLSSKGLPKLCLRSGYGSLYLLPPTAKGSLLQQNIIRNHFVCLFIYCQSCLVLSQVSGYPGHPDSVRHGLPLMAWYGPEVKVVIRCHSHKFCSTITSARLTNRTDCRSKVLWLRSLTWLQKDSSGS